MYCDEYENTGCNIKTCCYECNISDCALRCNFGKEDCDCLREEEPVPYDERYEYRDI